MSMRGFRRQVQSGAMIAGLLFVASLFIVRAPTVASPIPDDRLVVPGLRMGKWTLAMTIDDLVRMHGRPIRVQIQAGLPPAADAVYDYVAFSWDRVPVTATTLSGRPRAVMLSLGFLSSGARRFATDKGVVFGTLRADLVKAYGDPTAETMPQPSETRMIYDRIGIAFNLSVGRRVSSIAIFRPGTADRFWHLL